MSNDTTQELASLLLIAETERRPIPPLVERHPGLRVDEAYAVQLEVVRRKLARGMRVVGKKIGLTSRPMQVMFGVDQPDYGHLLDTMLVEHGATVRLERLLQPRIEGEIAFVLARDLEGPGLDERAVLERTEYVCPALEIVDSRIRDWKITLADTIADNASSGLFVLGPGRVRPDSLDLRLTGMVLERNGEVAFTGAGAAVLGHPATAVAWLGNQLAEFGLALREGEIILSGSLAAAFPPVAGDRVCAEFGHLGLVEVAFG